MDAAEESLLQHQEDQRAVSAGMLNDFERKVILLGFLWDQHVNIFKTRVLISSGSRISRGEAPTL